MKEYINRVSSYFEPFQDIGKKAQAILMGIFIGLVLVLFESFHNPMIPPPSEIAAKMWSIWMGNDVLMNGESFFDNLQSSLFLTCKGMGISILIALFVSYLSVVPVFRPAAQMVVKFRYLTLTGLILLFTLITKDGAVLKISLLIFGIVPFFVTTLLGIIGQVPTDEYDLCRTLKMNSWEMLWEIVIVGRIDSAFEAMRHNFAISWMMITMVEGFSMSQGGLGTLIIKFNKYYQLAGVYAVIINILLLGVVIDFALGYIRKTIFPYAVLR